MGYDYCWWSTESRFGISFLKRKRKDVEKGRVHIGTDLIELFIFMSDQASKITHSYRIQDFWKILFQCRPDRDRDHGQFHSVIFIVQDNAVDIIDILMKPVVVELILNPKEDQNAYGHAYCQPGYVDERKDFLPFHFAECHFKIVLEHVESPIQWIWGEWWDRSDDLSPIPKSGPLDPFLCSDRCVYFVKVPDSRIADIPVYGFSQYPSGQSWRSVDGMGFISHDSSCPRGASCQMVSWMRLIWWRAFLPSGVIS